MTTPKILRFDGACATDPGWRFKENQDAVLLDSEVLQGTASAAADDRVSMLAAVADGLAHAPCGSRASRMVLDELVELASNGLSLDTPRVIQQRMLSRAAGTRCEGMGSTLAALHLRDGSARVIAVGDSRVYLWRNQQLRQVTVDHTIAARMVREGDLTLEQAERAGSLYSDLDSALVASEFEEAFDVFGTVEPLSAGDYWLCFSDGITSALSDAEIAAKLANDPQTTPERFAMDIVDSSKRVRSSDDNLSAVVVRVRKQSVGE